MFLLDTNVVSELRKVASGKADQNVVRWARTTATQDLYISVVTLMEIETGVLLIERRDAAQGAVLRNWLETNILRAFADRILVVDEAVARRCAALHVPHRRPDRDAFIAASALVRGLTVVTRNTSDFIPTGVALINPWTANG